MDSNIKCILFWSSVLLGCIIYFIPPYKLLITYIHEKGHAYHLKLMASKYHLPYSQSKIEINKEDFYNLKNLFKHHHLGKTHNKIVYEFLTANKKYFDIRVNAIFGLLFTSLFHTILGLFIYLLLSILQLSILNIIAYTLPKSLAFFEILNFITTSDGKYFCFPQTFVYTDN